MLLSLLLSKVVVSQFVVVTDNVFRSWRSHVVLNSRVLVFVCSSYKAPKDVNYFCSESGQIAHSNAYSSLVPQVRCSLTLQHLKQCPYYYLDNSVVFLACLSGYLEKFQLNFGETWHVADICVTSSTLTMRTHDDVQHVTVPLTGAAVRCRWTY